MPQQLCPSSTSKVQIVSQQLCPGSSSTSKVLVVSQQLCPGSSAGADTNPSTGWAGPSSPLSVELKKLRGTQKEDVLEVPNSRQLFWNQE